MGITGAPINTELWAEYAVGALFIVVRFFARWKVVGLSNFHFEDLFMGIALVMYTAITAIIHEIEQHGAIIGQTPESVYLLPPEYVESFIVGQKLTWADWVIYLFYVWSLKATLLTMFARLTRNLGWQTIMCRVVMGYAFVAFCGSFLTHVCICLPVHKSWQIQPYPGDECALRNLNYKIITFFNASSDIAIVAVPIPIIITAKISILRKVSLVFLLCSGCFVAIAAILRAYYSLQDLSQLPIAAGWTSRELFVASVVVSIPGIKPLFSQTKWISRSSNKSKGINPSGQLSDNKAPSRNRNWAHELVTIGGSTQPAAGIDAGSKGRSEWRVGAKEIKGHPIPSDGGSEDFILENGQPEGDMSRKGSGGTSGDDGQRRIQITR